MAKIGINMTTGVLQRDDLVVGIDFGTTNSLIAIVDEQTGKARVLKEYDNSSLVPSVLHYSEQGEWTVGDSAKDKWAQQQAGISIFSTKRLIGKSFEDLSHERDFLPYEIIRSEDDNALVKVRVGDTFYTPIELASIILKTLKQRAEHILKCPIRRAVVTVPAYFNDTQRQATRDAGKLAGLDVLRIVNEPTAASLAYGIGLNKTDAQTVAVYDLGGGTFDISILRIQDGVFEVLSTNGDTHLGGDDMDQALARHWIKAYELLHAPAVFARLVRIAEQAKKHLSKADHFSATFDDHTNLTIDKKTFDELIASIIEKTISCAQAAMQDASLTIADIDTVLLVGGSTRVPAVHKAVRDFFKREPNASINPDEIVALGAAVQADVLAGNNKEVLLLDVTPLSLGIETMGGLMDVLITRNSKIPTRAGRQYTTRKDGQSGMIISVYQGERDVAVNNRKLASFILKGIPAMPAGLPKVEISFSLDADGILHVRAEELRSGVSQEISVQARGGLDDETVETMLEESLTHAQADIAARALIEAKTEGEQLLDITRKFMEKNKSQLTQEEIQASESACKDLENVLATDNKNAIQLYTENLQNITRPYAERVMNSVISDKMRGKKI